MASYGWSGGEEKQFRDAIEKAIRSPQPENLPFIRPFPFDKLRYFTQQKNTINNAPNSYRISIFLDLVID